MYTQSPILCPSRRHFIIFFVIHSSLCLSYRHSLHSTSRTIQSELKVRNIWVKHWDRIRWDNHSFMFWPSSHSCLYHTGTHYTPPWQQWNRSSRCTMFGWSIDTQYGEIITCSCFYRHLIPVSFTQTLTTLNLWYNQIGDQGTQCLGEALRHNTVR